MATRTGRCEVKLGVPVVNNEQVDELRATMHAMTADGRPFTRLRGGSVAHRALGLRLKPPARPRHGAPARG